LATYSIGGYKGYGLAFLVEILCGILAGSSYGPHIRDWKKNWQIADLVSSLIIKKVGEKECNLFKKQQQKKQGQCFVAINPSFFADEFETRLQDLMDLCRQMEPVIKY
jgi:LDH2 family malate/lactate/ureidoglycolate dehydrogenase